MLLKLLADSVLLLYFGFVLFVVLGGIAVFFRRQAAWFHVPAVLWSAAINLNSNLPFALCLKQSELLLVSVDEN